MRARGLGALRRLLRSERASVLALTAFAMPMMVGAAGLATDGVQWMLWQRQLQQQADAAAVAGAYAYARDAATAATAAANEALAIDTGENIVFDPANKTITPSVATVTENGKSYPQKQVLVALQGSKRLPFSGLFLEAAPIIRASATAGVVHDGEYCIITFGKQTNTGITVTGNAAVNLGCGMATNANGAAALEGKGDPKNKVVTTVLSAVGQIAGATKFTTDEAISYGVPQPDPYEGKTGAKPNPCTAQTVPAGNQLSGTLPMQPGCYASLDFGNADYALAPGTYYVDGPVKVNAQTKLTGTGVTLVLSPTATVDINGGATVDLSAPTSGEYAGIVIFQRKQPGAVAAKSHINGGSNFKMTGAVYLPNGAVEFNGGSTANSTCVLLVADSVDFSGNTNWSNSCPANTDYFAGVRVRLVS